MTSDTAALLHAATAWAKAHYPGLPVECVAVHLYGLSQPVRLPVPPHQPGTDAPQFEPNEMQDCILVAFDGKALRTDALAAAAGYDRRKLFRKPKGGLAELVEQGLVASDLGRGYYRPDAPPPDED